MLYNGVPKDVRNIRRKHAVTWSNAIPECSTTEPGLVSTLRPNKELLHYNNISTSLLDS